MPELRSDDGFERYNWKQTMALNAKLKMWLWTPNWRCDMMTLKAELEMNNDFEHQTEDVALNAKLKMWHDDSKWWTKTMALNAKLNMRL